MILYTFGKSTQWLACNFLDLRAFTMMFTFRHEYFYCKNYWFRLQNVQSSTKDDKDNWIICHVVGSKNLNVGRNFRRDFL